MESEKKIEAVLKLTQSEAILTLSFNPLTYELFSGGAADLALFIPGKKEIPKERYKEKIICWVVKRRTDPRLRNHQWNRFI